MDTSHYLIFGDLHGRILPAFRLALAWERDHEVRLDGLLQVGDLGFFPDPGRLDKATARHAADDPLELGACLVAEPSVEADAIFHGVGGSPPSLWFTAGNHEDFDALARLESAGNRRSGSFAVDAYGFVRGIRDGMVEDLPGPLRVGAVWGIDDKAPNARRKTPDRGRIKDRSLTALAGASFDVLLSHEGPRDAVLPGAGSEGLDALISIARPAFAFFGHYGSRFGRVSGPDETTQVFHLAGLELKRAGASAEAGSVGLLTWQDGAGTFDFLDESWLRGFTRYNWRYPRA
ncbi:metallophosphoesterase family protein [Singulisphaera sp. PoT]|uniref:metallophosphoesterase family protein n=1 Tax=Singulisphaera sp. PoT TaxID=3411797 RepID=UPI003BF61978